MVGSETTFLAFGAGALLFTGTFFFDGPFPSFFPFFDSVFDLEVVGGGSSESSPLEAATLVVSAVR